MKGLLIGRKTQPKFGVFFVSELFGQRAVNILNKPTSLYSGFRPLSAYKILKGLIEMEKSNKELEVENEALRSTLSFVLAKLKEVVELLEGGCHE